MTAKQVPGWARLAGDGPAFCTLDSTVSMYVFSKVRPLVGQLIGKDVPVIELTQLDYYLIGTVFVFLFGARTVEKVKGKA